MLLEQEKEEDVSKPHPIEAAIDPPGLPRICTSITSKCSGSPQGAQEYLAGGLFERRSKKSWLLLEIRGHDLEALALQT